MAGFSCGREILELTIINVSLSPTNECHSSLQDPTLNIFDLREFGLVNDPVLSVPFVNGKASVSIYAGDLIFVGINDNDDCITDLIHVTKGFEKDYEINMSNDLSTIRFQTNVLFNETDSVYFSLTRQLNSPVAINSVPNHSGNKLFGIAYADLQDLTTYLPRNETYFFQYAPTRQALRLSSVLFTFQTNSDSILLNIP